MYQTTFKMGFEGMGTGSYIETTKFFCKGSDRKHFRHCGPYCLYHNYFPLHLQPQSGHRQYINKRDCLCSNTTFISKSGGLWIWPKGFSLLSWSLEDELKCIAYLLEVRGPGGVKLFWDLMVKLSHRKLTETGVEIFMTLTFRWGGFWKYSQIVLDCQGWSDR